MANYSKETWKRHAGISRIALHDASHSRNGVPAQSAISCLIKLNNTSKKMVLVVAGGGA